jgi:predicted transcriptional regulator of viral defense system
LSCLCGSRHSHEDKIDYLFLVLRRSADGRAPDRNALFETASPQAGYFTLSQAREAGISPQLLQFYVRAACVDRAGRGIFRLKQFPSTFEHEDLVPLWLWSQQQGVFSHATALTLHELSDALPAKHHLSVPTSWRIRRLRAPSGLVLHYADLGPTERTWIGPVPVTTPLRTLEDAVAGALDETWIEQATREGLRRGLFSRREATAAIARGRARRPS